MFIDTSGLLCYFHRDETSHTEAVRLFQKAPLRLVHDLVLAEFLPLCRARGVHPSGALEFLADLLDNPEVTLVWVDDGLFRAAIELLQDRFDKSYSLCDAVSFLLMRMYGEPTALTTDHHFEQDGFVRLLTP